MKGIMKAAHKALANAITMHRMSPDCRSFLWEMC